MDITVPTSATQKVVTAQSYFGEESTDNPVVFKYGKSKQLSGAAFKVEKILMNGAASGRLARMVWLVRSNGPH